MHLRRFGLAEGANVPGNSWLPACLGGIKARDRRLPATGSTRSAAIEGAPGAIVGEVTLATARPAAASKSEIPNPK